MVEKEFELENSTSDLISALTKATQLGEMFKKIEKIEKKSNSDSTPLIGIDLENFEKKENFLKSVELISNYESESIMINQE